MSVKIVLMHSFSHLGAFLGEIVLQSSTLFSSANLRELCFP